MKKGVVFISLLLLFVGLIMYAPTITGKVYVLDTPRGDTTSGGSNSNSNAQEYSPMYITSFAGEEAPFNISGALGENYEVHIE